MKIRIDDFLLHTGLNSSKLDRLNIMRQRHVNSNIDAHQGPICKAVSYDQSHPDCWRNHTHHSYMYRLTHEVHMPCVLCNVQPIFFWSFSFPLRKKRRIWDFQFFTTLWSLAILPHQVRLVHVYMREGYFLKKMLFCSGNFGWTDFFVIPCS